MVPLQLQLFNGLCRSVSLHKLFVVQHTLNFISNVSYNQQIPVDVKVPAYAYQNVSVLYFDNVIKFITYVHTFIDFRHI